jgi:hypothetical protein
MLATIQHLREIAERCLSGEPLHEDLARWLGTSLDKFLNHQARTIEDAMGIRSSRGGVPWWMEEAIRKRDRVLRGLAELYAANRNVSAQARCIYTLTTRYAASAWRFDRSLSESPPGYTGTPSEYLWRAFNSGAPMPIGERQLRNVLAR